MKFNLGDRTALCDIGQYQGNINELIIMITTVIKIIINM